MGLAQIGFGYWGPNLLRNLVDLPTAKVIGLVDTDLERLADAGRRYPAVRTSREYGPFLADPAIEGVILATPAHTHARLASEALRAGKHVLVEKPLATSIEECEKLISLANERGRVLMVGHTFVYNPAVALLKRYIEDGELGEIYYLYSQRLNLGRVRQDVNALWNFAPHDVSIVLHLLGEKPVEVSARGFSYLQAGIEDVVFATLVFAGGRTAHIHISWLDPHKVRKMTVVGNRRMAVYDDVAAEARIVLYDRGVDRLPTADSPRDFDSFADFQLRLRSGDVTIPALDFREPLRTECEHFVQCILEDKQPITDGHHGLDVVRVLVAAQQSIADSGRPVEVANL